MGDADGGWKGNFTQMVDYWRIMQKTAGGLLRLVGQELPGDCLDANEDTKD